MHALLFIHLCNYLQYLSEIVYLFHQNIRCWSAFPRYVLVLFCCWSAIILDSEVLPDIQTRVLGTYESMCIHIYKFEFEETTGRWIAPARAAGHPSRSQHPSRPWQSLVVLTSAEVLPAGGLAVRICSAKCARYSFI